MQVSSLHVRKDLPALSGYSEGEQQQYGKVTLGFPHWAPEKEHKSTKKTEVINMIQRLQL